MGSPTPHTADALRRRPIVVVNPNASDAVTRSIEASVSTLSTEREPVRCVTLRDGPPAIESHADFERAIPCVGRFIRNETEAAGFVVACFSDPGVAEARSATARPVVGVQEASVALALTLGSTFGIVALVEASVERQRRALTATGLLGRLAGSRPVGLGIAALADEAVAWPRIRGVGERLCLEDGADVLVLGCAGMGAYRIPLERELGIPVVDPCQAGVAVAQARIRLGLSHRVSPRDAFDPARA